MSLKNRSKIQEDQRIDPRIKQVFGSRSGDTASLHRENPGDATSREQILEEANSEEAAASR
jgi:hypothetical protein